MASCTYNPKINSVNPYAVLNVTQQSQNIVINKTTVRYELLLYRPSKISSSANKAYSIVVNGKTVKSGTTTIGGSGTKSIASGTAEIPHNADGTKSISFSFSLAFDIDWNAGHIGTGRANGSMTLTTIPRATTPTLNPARQEFGKSIVINLPKASTAFTHTLQHDFYAGTWTTFATKNVSNSLTLQIPIEWASKIPNTKEGGGRIKCITYNGNTVIGEKIVNFVAVVPSTMKPTIKDVLLSESVASIAEKFGYYVQNQSKLNISIDASGVNGSTIKSYRTTICGTNYSDKSFVSNALSQSGTISIVTVVTDSRGMSVSATKQVDVVAYNPPRVIAISSERGDDDGNPSAIGRTALINLDYIVTSLNNANTCKCDIYLKKTDDVDWELLDTKIDYVYKGILGYKEKYLEDFTYLVKVVICDFFNQIEVVYDGVPIAFTLYNVNRSGTNITFGGISKRTNERCFDFESPVYFKESILPYDGENADIGSASNPFSNGYFNNIYINGKSHGNAKVLWDNAFFMDGNPVQVATLTEAVSAQQHGIILVFSEYVNGAAANYSYQSFFVSKKEVEHRANVSHCFPLFGAEFAVTALKFLFIHDTKIVGDARNSTSGTKSGIAYDGKRFVMRTVYGI